MAHSITDQLETVCPLASGYQGSLFFSFHLRLSVRKQGLEELAHSSPGSGPHHVAELALPVSASRALTRQVCVAVPGNIMDFFFIGPCVAVGL